ncbi:ThiF family adenylyltransferase [Shewanella sedimentimangrovi]|uniref:ThiF family adenylyltransferase n=1 Tax=Shewanella sedimentimangrovi TaxID=2814293 RepID=A0ABX7R1V5_9GAMM|nr:ThiF family adenylyltransferase [Shewanella sedimentimangrovi]QSX37799.1 ThiF family adenylyltransferase [Shewanella sedimentimangrovi]
MSQKPIALNPSVIRLIKDGFDVEVTNQHLLIHSVPYLNSKLEVKAGILACAYSEMGEVDTHPYDHTMWLQGEVPCMGSGQPMVEVINHSRMQELFSGFLVNHYLSNKPNNQPFTNFYDKVHHYHTLLVSQARLIKPNADARIGTVHRERNQDSVFQYPDTASSRVGITAITQKFENDKIAIIGLGGTGSYILDQLAKTPVREIHLFDDDIMEPHNAYRAPGAVPFEILETVPKKVDYYYQLYSNLHRGVVPHSIYVTNENLEELDHFNFVFLSIDSGTARSIITSYLIIKGIPFIDVGLGIERLDYDNGNTALQGSCRVTLATPNKCDHVSKLLVLEDEHNDEVLYESNIQISELNAMNALLAISKWKQYKGFYHDDTENAHNLIYTIAIQSIVRSE